MVHGWAATRAELPELTWSFNASDNPSSYQHHPKHSQQHNCNLPRTSPVDDDTTYPRLSIGHLVFKMEFGNKGVLNEGMRIPAHWIMTTGHLEVAC